MALKLFKPIPVLVQIWTNKMEVTRLDSGKKITRTPKKDFSNERNVFADFDVGELLLREILKELMKSKLGISKSTEIVLQQMERSEGGLSGVEMRSYRDLCEFAGAQKVVVFDEFQLITPQRALREIENAK